MRINTHIRHSKEFYRESLFHKHQATAQGWETLALKEYAGELNSRCFIKKIGKDQIITMAEIQYD